MKNGWNRRLKPKEDVYAKQRVKSIILRVILYDLNKRKADTDTGNRVIYYKLFIHSLAKTLRNVTYL